VDKWAPLERQRGDLLNVACVAALEKRVIYLIRSNCHFCGELVVCVQAASMLFYCLHNVLDQRVVGVGCAFASKSSFIVSRKLAEALDGEAC
jgi:hypothetical protein